MTDIFKAHLRPLSTGTLILMLADLTHAAEALRSFEIEARGGPFEHGIPRALLMTEIERLSHYITPCEHTAPEEDEGEDEMAGEVEVDYSDMSLWVQRAQDIPPFLMVNSAQEAAILAGALDRDAENWRWTDEMHPSVFAADQAAVARDLAERARCAVREWSARVMAQEGQHGS